MNCHNCGKINSSQAKFCGKCGYSLKALLEQESVVSTPQAVLESSALESISSRDDTQKAPPQGVQQELTRSIESSRPDTDLEVDRPVVPQSTAAAGQDISHAEPTLSQEVTESSSSATELKTLINSQFNNNYTNQAAIKRYLDAHTEQLKAITFQLESIKNFQATINYELIINEINDKYNAIAESISQRPLASNYTPPEDLESLLGEVDEKTHFLFEKINSLLLNHNHQLLNNFESVIQNVEHKNQSTFNLLENQLKDSNEVVAQYLKQFLADFKTLEQEESIHIESKILDHINEIKQQSLDATLEMQKKTTAIEELLNTLSVGASAEPTSKLVDLVAKHIKSQALTGFEKISTLLDTNNKALSVSIGLELSPLMDKKFNAMKQELLHELSNATLGDAQHGLKKSSSTSVSLNKVRALVKHSDGTLGAKEVEDESEVTTSLGLTTFITGVLCGVSVLLAGLSFYNFVQHEVTHASVVHPKASAGKAAKHEE
jgi:hypothetical protein